MTLTETEIRRLRRVLALQDIRDLMSRYARGVDRRDWDQVRDCYHPDARDEHGSYRGSVAGFIEWVSARHAGIPACVHFLGNSTVELESDTRAVGETYFVALQRNTPEAEAGAEAAPRDDIVFGRYLDRFEDRGAGWRIAARQVVYDLVQVKPLDGRERQPAGPFGRRDATDPVFALLGRLADAG